MYTLAAIASAIVIGALWILDYVEEIIPKSHHRILVIRRRWGPGCVVETVKKLKDAGLKVHGASFERTDDLASVDMKDAGAIGLSQALAIVPGTSRSGITMTTGLFRGLDREGAARFSFLLSTPAIAAAAGKALHDLIKHGGIGPDMWGPFMVGIAVSAVTGCVVIAWFLRYLRRGTLQFFVGYRIIFGLVVLGMALFVKNG
jgi:undecaprenyl pyrophosphate phosphatase UppP